MTFWNAGWAPFVVFPLMMLVVMLVMVTVMTSMGGGGWSPFSRRGPGDRPARPPSGEDPLVVLRERYARGEIDQQEFERILDGLRRSERGQDGAPTSSRGDR